MKKQRKDEKARRYVSAKARYASKRRTKKWKNRKKLRRRGIRVELQKQRRQAKKPFVVHPAPKSFSLIADTNEVLRYFKEAEDFLSNGENVTLDISNVDTLTPDTIALMVASIHDIDFHHGSRIQGNAPQKPALLKLFTESGFYDYVAARGTFTSNKKGLLHKEVNRKVVSQVAKDASLTGIRHVFGNEKPFEPLYEILIESMSNTNNHADLHHHGKCNWWLYVYCDPKKKLTSYSFLDLGVGIFESVVVQNYLKNAFKGTRLYKNINLVDDLISGKIQSQGRPI
jgi:hypothetical protein